LAIVDDYEVVVAGVAAFLADEHIDVSRPAPRPQSSVTSTSSSSTPSLRSRGGASILRTSSATPTPGWCFSSWTLRRNEPGRGGLGARGYLSKVLTGPDVAAAFGRVTNDEIVILPWRQQDQCQRRRRLARTWHETGDGLRNG
jgi:hypothetical protein